MCGLCGCLWWPSVLCAIPTHYKPPEGKTLPSGLVPTPEQSPCQALQIYWARPTGTNASVNDLVELSCYYQKMSENRLLVPKDLEWGQDWPLSSGNTRTTWFVWTVSAAMDTCQTTDRHCPDSDGAFRDQALLSIGTGRHCYSGGM